jgi:hypothetical protein
MIGQLVVAQESIVKLNIDKLLAWRDRLVSYSAEVREVNSTALFNLDHTPSIQINTVSNYA